LLLTKNKIIAPEQLETWVAERRQLSQTIVTLNGSFDLLHAGHLHIIFSAAEQGDCFLMLLNSDASIRKYKSPDRPIISLDNRLKMVAALEVVDAVSWFEETDPRQILRKIGPDVHVNGAEYGANCIEAEVVKERGGRIHIVELVPGLSTSNVIAKIQSLKGPVPCV
jgi:D-glycero-beta-D-manno-heptose 1-phosphate adenylyltransferase